MFSASPAVDTKNLAQIFRSLFYFLLLFVIVLSIMYLRFFFQPFKQHRLLAWGAALTLWLTLVVPCHSTEPEIIALLAWGKRTGSDYDIHFSRKSVNGQWSDPVVIASSDNLEILPTMGRNAEGTIWIVWNELTTEGGQLRFRHFRNGFWQPAETIQTDTTEDMAPSLIIDGHDVPWLVWAGFNGDDDIYYSRWNGTGWDLPKMVNNDDDWPDILPRLSLDEKEMPRVVWSGYNGDHYVNYVNYWNGSQWILEQELAGKTSFVRAGADSSLHNQLPDFLDSTDQAVLYIKEINNRARVLHREELQ